MKHDRTPNPEEAKAANVPDAATTVQWNPSRREIVAYGVIGVALVAAVASCTVLAAENGAFNEPPAPTPTPESAENYAIDHDRYTTLLSDHGYNVLCYSNDLTTKKVVGERFEAIVPPVAYCEDVSGGSVLDTNGKLALGVQQDNPINGTIDVFVSGVTITDRNQNQIPSPSR